MNRYLEELNENQYKATITNKNKVLVMAGAGSGKTRVLTSRIKYLLDNGAYNDEICAFTFTVKAAKEMKYRLQAMIKETNIQFMNDVPLPIISTFHSFCYSYITVPELYSKLGYTKKPDVISESVKSNIITEILNAYKKDYSNIPFVRAISRIKNKATVIGVSDIDQDLLNVVYHEYQDRLKKSNMIDFDDMIPLFIRLCDDDAFLEIVQRKYVLIDECQDINQIQYDLIKILSQKFNNVFMVGDGDQLIYTFRNSDMRILYDFQSTCDEIIILNQNYRCNQEILSYANKLIEYNPNRIKKNLFSNIEVVSKVEFKEFTTTDEQAVCVANKINSLIKEGTKPENIAVLFRNNNQSYPIEKELKLRKIPYALYGGQPFFEYKEIKLIMYAYRFCMNSKNEISFEEIYNYPSRNIEFSEYQAFMKDYHMQDLNLATYASGYALNPKFQKLGFDLLKLLDLFEQESGEDFFMSVLEILHLKRFLKDSNQQKPQYARIMALKDMIKDINKDELLESFNEIILDNFDSMVTNKVSLLTIHKAKGLEFEFVFIIGFNEGILPGFNKKMEELEEERRLAYVAITRAKQHLYLYCAVIHFINGNIAKLKPSSFLSEAGIKETKELDFFKNYWYNH